MLPHPCTTFLHPSPLLSPSTRVTHPLSINFTMAADPWWTLQHPPMVATAGDSQRERRVFVLYKFTQHPPTTSPSIRPYQQSGHQNPFTPPTPTHPGGLMELWGRQ